jgi:hypothetical protein
MLLNIPAPRVLARNLPWPPNDSAPRNYAHFPAPPVDLP